MGGHLDDLEENEENIAHIVDRKVLGARVTHGLGRRAMGLWLYLDDGSRFSIDGLITGGIEVDWLSPDEAFDLDKEAMEEEIADGGP